MVSIKKSIVRNEKYFYLHIKSVANHIKWVFLILCLNMRCRIDVTAKAQVSILEM